MGGETGEGAICEWLGQGTERSKAGICSKGPVQKELMNERVVESMGRGEGCHAGGGDR